ncbi:hypothetical protein AVDCRST_MAG94-7066 [uncultured Leptolyngbya sp.]|uniref:Uncharacterized protein n=1 Tax=uncultured Leptolyngbya sp. TaxID=332963 RepID=A0A6J4PPC2_9CYAN|nr:hypothetical protein AVDCRST_MAG94-7066 [uncultured Leptolyngbya sp.]
MRLCGLERMRQCGNITKSLAVAMIEMKIMLKPCHTRQNKGVDRGDSMPSLPQSELELLNEKIKATAGIAQHAEREAAEIAEMMPSLVAAIKQLQTHLPTGVVPVPLGDAAQAIDLTDEKVEYLRKHLFGAAEGAKQVERGEGNSYTGEV